MKKVDSRNNISFRTNTEALRYIGITENIVRPHFVIIKNIEENYVVWFNYEWINDENNGEYLSSSSRANDYINLYLDGGDIIKQIIPKSKTITDKYYDYFRVVFVKNGVDIKFSGVYVLDHIEADGYIEFFRRISYTFDLNDIYKIDPAPGYFELKNNKTHEPLLNKFVSYDEIIKNKDNLNSLKQDVMDKEDDVALDELLNYELNNTELDDLTYRAAYEPVIEKETKSVNVYKRSRIVAINALVRSQEKCEANDDPNHHLFKNNKGRVYLEVHHLIPMCAQKDYDIALDRDENVVCLCPNCHKEIHFGRNKRKLIETLLEKRREMLQSVGLNVTVDDIEKYY